MCCKLHVPDNTFILAHDMQQCQLPVPMSMHKSMSICSRIACCETVIRVPAVNTTSVPCQLSIPVVSASRGMTGASRQAMQLQEASTLLSALAAALSNCRLAWPAFLPVHDPLRDAHWGIGAAGLATVHYDSDSIHLSKNPTRLQQVNPFCALHRT